MREFCTTSLAVSALLATTTLASPAISQIAPPGPVRDAIDANGVDLFSGRIMLQARGLKIGEPDRGMSYSRVYRQTAWTDDLIATLEPGTAPVVSQGLKTESSVFSGGIYVSTEGNGATLTAGGGIWTYTGSNGTVIHFSTAYKVMTPASTQTGAQVADITRPDGTKYTFNYGTATYCIGTIFTARLFDLCELHRAFKASIAAMATR